MSEKRDAKGKGSERTRSSGVKQAGVPTYSDGAMPKHIRMWLLAPTRMLPLQVQRCLLMEEWDTSACLCTQATPVMTKINAVAM